MAGILPTTTLDWDYFGKATAQLLGGASVNQRDAAVKALDLMLASGHWSIPSSSDGTNFGAGNRITDYTKLGTVGAWFVLRNLDTGAETCMRVSVVGGWLEFQRWWSADGGFTGGGATTAPTAPHQTAYGKLGGFLGQAVGNEQYYVACMTSSDGKDTRVVFTSGGMAGKMVAFWQFDELFYGPEPWATPRIVADWLNGNNSSPRLTVGQYVPRGGGTTTASKFVLLPGNVTYEWEASTENYAAVIVEESPSAHEQTGQYVWISPVGVYVRSSAGRNGHYGWVVDQWWTSTAMADGDTCGDDQQFIVFGGMMLPWDGTTPAMGRTSVNHPTSAFYGRADYPPCPGASAPALLEDVPGLVSFGSGSSADASLGIDVDTRGSLDVPLTWGLCSGKRNLGNALVRRLAFLRSKLNAGLTQTQVSQLRSEVAAAVEADERVQAITKLDVTFTAATSTLTISLRVSTAEGPFDFIFPLSPTS